MAGKEFKDWCDKPEVVMTGKGWCARINGCDVFDSINQYGVKTLRSFDIVQGLGSKEEAQDFLANWLRNCIGNINGESK